MVDDDTKRIIIEIIYHEPVSRIPDFGDSDMVRIFIDGA